jgi:spore germination cell wall hydrolase CwlJ-like protein
VPRHVLSKRPRAYPSSVRPAAALLAVALWIGFPTVVARQDMAELISSGAGWHAFLERSAAGSIHKAELAFSTDSLVTNSIAGGGVVAPGIGTVAFKGKSGGLSDTPDEERVNGTEKRGRILHVAPVAPPKSFNAGSVFERQSMNLRPTIDEVPMMAFVKSDISGQEIKIASAFHVKQERRVSPGVPAMLASLVNNDTPDILATAYAPPKPDYARSSPFASLLKGEDENAGRFIPPVGERDHGWMKEPLPAHVFTKAEQKCLATGIYFEARGESLRGQAAVAQVILNRVRNPTYPGTICGVVYQNQHLRNRCQFSFACDGIADVIRSPGHYKVAEDVAMAVTAGKIFIPEVASSTHYYAQYVSPRWARSMERMKKIGLHIFYRTYGGGWN